MKPEIAAQIFPVMKGFAEGETVQFKANGGLWKDSTNPTFNETYDWRIKPNELEVEFIYCPIDAKGAFAGYPRLQDETKQIDCTLVRFATCPEGYEVRKIEEKDQLGDFFPDAITIKLPPLPKVPAGFSRWVARGFGWHSLKPATYAYLSLEKDRWLVLTGNSSGGPGTYYIEAVR